MSKKSEKRAGWIDTRGAGVGFVVGVLIPWVGMGMLSDFIKRLVWMRGGGAGESAEWGEPLFFMVVYGLPAGLIGAIVGAGVGAIIRWAVTRKKQSS